MRRDNYISQIGGGYTYQENDIQIPVETLEAQAMKGVLQILKETISEVGLGDFSVEIEFIMVCGAVFKLDVKLSEVSKLCIGETVLIYGELDIVLADISRIVVRPTGYRKTLFDQVFLDRKAHG